MNCPHCHEEIDEVVEINDATKRPKPGSAMLCAFCLGLCFFTDAMTLRKPRRDERHLHRVHLKRAIEAHMVRAEP